MRRFFHCFMMLAFLVGGMYEATRTISLCPMMAMGEKCPEKHANAVSDCCLNCASCVSSPALPLTLLPPSPSLTKERPIIAETSVTQWLAERFDPPPRMI